MNHITGTAHSSASKLRFVLLLSLLLCAFAQQSVRSQDGAAPLRDDARLCGLFPCPRPEAQIEPQAGKWKTWVLSSGRQLKLPPPPHRAASEKEIGVLKQLSSERDLALEVSLQPDQTRRAQSFADHCFTRSEHVALRRCARRSGRRADAESGRPVAGRGLGGAPLAGQFHAAHHAFFAGFLPTPIAPGPHPRLFAARFEGSATIAPQTCVFDAPDIATGLAQRGYHTVCIGGVGFFNKQNPLGRVLPGLFAESHWSPRLGVTDPCSTENQARLAVEILARLPKTNRVFLFINVSALHEPNRVFLPGAERDSVETQAAALAYVDCHLPAVFDAMRRRAPVLAIVCSDHGTAYGEDGYFGHRVSHPVVWTVPYAEFVLPEVDDERV